MRENQKCRNVSKKKNEANEKEIDELVREMIGDNLLGNYCLGYDMLPRRDIDQVRRITGKIAKILDGKSSGVGLMALVEILITIIDQAVRTGKYEDLRKNKPDTNKEVMSLMYQ